MSLKVWYDDCPVLWLYNLTVLVVAISWLTEKKLCWSRKESFFWQLATRQATLRKELQVTSDVSNVAWNTSYFFNGSDLGLHGRMPRFYFCRSTD